MGITENKHSYFGIDLEVPQIVQTYDQEVRESLEKEIDLILARMGSSFNIFRFESGNNRRILYLFSIFQRKRKGQLLNLCQRQFDKKGVNYNVNSLTKSEFQDCLEKLKTDRDFTNVEKPLIFQDYRG